MNNLPKREGSKKDYESSEIVVVVVFLKEWIECLEKRDIACYLKLIQNY